MNQSSNVPSAAVLELVAIMEHITTAEQFVDFMHTPQGQTSATSAVPSLAVLEGILNAAKDTYIKQLRKLSPEERELVRTLNNQRT